MKNDELYTILGDIDEERIVNAYDAMTQKPSQLGRQWVRWGAAAACVILAIGVVLWGRNPIGTKLIAPSRVESDYGIVTSSVETTDDRENEYAVKEYAEEITADESVNEFDVNSQNEANTSVIPDEAAADESNKYHEAVTVDELTGAIDAFYGGAYLNDQGQYTVVLVGNTQEHREAVCTELGIQESTTLWEEGEYTFKYLTELQAKISEAMVNKELPYVCVSALYENKNRIVVDVTTEDEADLAELLALDTLGGAICIEYVEGGMATKEDLVEVK